MLVGYLQATDTLRVNLKQAEELFLKNNYTVLAQAMNIDAQKAQEIQAKLLPNPVFTADFNVYDPQNEKFFHTGNTGQKSFQLEQLFRLGGKRQSEIDLAKSNSQISELVFNDLVRQLKFQLYNVFYSMGEQNKLILQYGLRMNVLDSIISAFETQVAKGNLPLKDLVRLKTLYINLLNQKLELQRENFKLMSDLQVLVQTKAYILPEMEAKEMNKYEKTFLEEELLRIAMENRPDYQITEQNKALASQYLAYQKKLAVPDLTVFASYDQRGGAFVNQFNGGLALPLPVFNRNQGNIKTAKINSKIAELNQNAMKFSIETEIVSSLNIYNESMKEYRKITSLYSNDFDFTFNSISTNFQKRNVSLLEFVDFFEAYNSASYEITKSKLQLLGAAGVLNYNVSKNLFE